MSALGERSVAIDGRPAIDPNSAAYFFDLTPVLERCEGLRRNPERVALMCRNHVRQRAQGDLMIPRDNGFFLVMQNRGAEAADSLARDISVTLLELFFGTDCFHPVASLFRPVSQDEMAHAGIRVIARPPASASGPDPVAAPAAAARLQRPALFPDQTFGFLPMRNLHSENSVIYLGGIVGRRDGRMTFGNSALQDCDPKTRPWFDAVLLEHCLSLLGEAALADFPTAICASVSFETLAWSRGRQLYQQSLQAADAANDPLLIVKIDDIPPGTPTARLAEIVSTVRPLVKRVFVQLPDAPALLMHAGKIGAAGLCATVPAGATPGAVERLAAGLARAAGPQQALACVDGAGRDVWPLLRAAGIRFAAGSWLDGSLRLGNISGQTVNIEDYAA